MRTSETLSNKKYYASRNSAISPPAVQEIESRKGYSTAAIIIGVILFFIYMYFYIEHLHFHVTKIYAHVGSSHAQHALAHKYLYGKGVDKDEDQAMYWFRRSADNGHGDAAYNLVAGHLQGYNTDVQEHEIEPLLKQAHEQGTTEAEPALKNLFPHKY